MIKILVYEERIKQDLSQRKLAELAGIGKTTIAKVEIGKQSPTLDTLYMIGKGLDVPIESLYKYDYNF